MKIYIIGNVGSGKTTLAKKLSKELNIKHYELDDLVWNNSERRTDVEIKKLFNKIINKDSWIIEDGGRDIFKDGIKKSDIILYLDIPNYLVRISILKRWIKQILKIEKSDYKPTIKMLKKMYKWCNSNIKNKDEYLYNLKKESKKLIIIKNIKLFNFKELL